MLEGDDGFFMGEQGADETLRGMIEELKAQIESMKASERPVDNPQPAPAAEADDFAKLQRALMDSSISDAAEDQTGGDYDPVPFEVPEPEIEFKEQGWTLQPEDLDISSGESVELTVITNMRYDTAYHQLQMKTRRITVRNRLVVDVGQESDWTMITNGQAVAHSVVVS